MDIYEAFKTRRSIRKFSRERVSVELLKKFIDYARFSPSARNEQPVRYMIVSGEKADKVFTFTHWAGYLKGAHSPSFDERPDAYILFLVPKGLSKPPKSDIGAIAQSIGILAHSEGLGSCWMGAIDRAEIVKICSVPDDYEIDTLLSLGYPAESPKTVPVIDGDVRYFLDSDGVLNVPKFGLDEILF